MACNSRKETRVKKTTIEGLMHLYGCTKLYYTQSISFSKKAFDHIILVFDVI